MARLSKFPIQQTDKEIPFDKEGFINWCVKHQSLSEESAKQYASEVKTAYLILFEDDDTLFDDIRKAFIPRPLETVPEDWRPYVTEWSLLMDKNLDIEEEYYHLLDYIEEIENLNECGEISLETSKGTEEPLPIKNWVRSFRIYARYIKWRLDEILSNNYIPPIFLDKPTRQEEFNDIPLKKQFYEYLRKLHKKRDSKWRHKDERRKNSYPGEGASYSWVCHLTKLYNMILIGKIQRKIIISLDERLRMGQKLWLPKFKKALLEYADYYQRDFQPILVSDDDMSYGKAALSLYFDFMKAYAKNPEDYQPAPYNRKGKKSSA